MKKNNLKLEQFEKEFQNEIGVISALSLSEVSVPPFKKPSPYMSEVKGFSNLSPIGKVISGLMLTAPFLAAAFVLIFNTNTNTSADLAMLTKEEKVFIEESNQRMLNQISSLEETDGTK